MSLYARVLAPLLFRLDPERAHELVVRTGAWAAEHPGVLTLLRWGLAEPDPALRVRVFGLDFPNPLGLAAGFDKDGVAAPTWSALGFGSAELGTVTASPQRGNEPPRLLRLPEDRALVNRMGFNNAGALELARRVRAHRSRPWWPASPVGVNVGKGASVPLEDAADDYLASLRLVWSVADYLVLNVSSPNTPGLRRLHEGPRLEELLRGSRALASDLGPRPVLLKVAPDLSEEALDEVVGLSERHTVAGIVATNTTVSREGLQRDPNMAGGLSGAPLAERSLRTLHLLRARTRLPLVAAGGIDSAEGALARIDAGATLLQLYTGWIYGGPLLPRRILRGLASAVRARGHGDLQSLLDARDAGTAQRGP